MNNGQKIKYFYSINALDALLQKELPRLLIPVNPV